MGYQVKDIVAIMASIAPLDLAEAWDNSGLLIGEGHAPVSRIMVALDVTEAVVREAAGQHVDMLITHHPLIFKPIKNITDQDPGGSLMLSLIRSNIALYCAHTNLDKALGGVDDTLADVLGLEGVRPLTLEPADAILSDTHPGRRPHFGRIGRLPQAMDLKEYTKVLSKRLGISHLDLVGSGDREIKIVASCAGAGGDFLQEAVRQGADLFVTGELKYHEALSLMGAQTMAAAVVGHYASERPAMDVLISRLQNSLNAIQYKIEVSSSIYQCGPFQRLHEAD